MPAGPAVQAKVCCSGRCPTLNRTRIIEGYPGHEREARSRGIPMLGEGRVYKTPEEQIIEEIDPLRVIGAGAPQSTSGCSIRSATF